MNKGGVRAALITASPTTTCSTLAKSSSCVKGSGCLIVLKVVAGRLGGGTIGKDIGLVYLPVELAVADTELEVQVMGERVKATVADLPLVDPGGEKIRA